MTAILTGLDEYEVRHVIAHLLRSGHTAEAITSLQHLPFLGDAVTRTGVDALLSELDDVIRHADNDSGRGAGPRLRALRTGLSHSAHVLRRDPAQLPGQLLARLTAEQIGARLTGQIDQFAGWPWVRPLQQAHLAAPAALLRTIAARGRFIDVAAMSGDGSVIGSGDRDGFVAIWEAGTGRELARLRQFDSYIVGLSVVDEQTIVVATGRGPVVRVGLRTETIEARADGEGRISAFAATPDMFFVGYADGRVAALAAADLHTHWVRDTGAGEVNAVAACHGGVVAATRDGAVVLLSDPPTEPRHLARLPTRLHSVAVAPDQTVLAGGKDGIVYRLSTEGLVGKLIGHRNQVRAIVVTAADPLAALSASYDGSVLRWDLVTGTPTLVGRHAGWALALAANGDVAVSGSEDGTLRMWRLSLAEGTPQPVARGVRAVALSADGTCAAAAGPGRLLRVVALPWGEEILARRLPGRDVTGVAVTPTGDYVLACANDGSVWRVDLAAGECRRLGRHGRGLDSLKLAAGGQLAISAGRDSTVRVWDVRSAEPVATFRADAWFGAMTITPDGARIAAADWDYHIQLFGRRRSRPMRTFVGHEQTISCLTFVRQGRALVSGSWDGTVRLWPMRSSSPGWVVAHDEWVTELAVTPDDRLVVVGYASGLVRVHRLRDGKQVHHLRGHESFVTAVELTPDGKHAVTAGGEGTLRVWSLADGRQVCAFDEEPALSCCTVTGGDPVTVFAGDNAGELRTYLVQGDPD
ncbi:WD40 repeat domain-containing protein [Actinoplanes sp. NPDC024001]|uniref:WD40 repeat domain-containing protein n=1 Tax=Actinoplanes sp. NPDC024001 TaxID=3154598 RepID=UPI0033C2D594